MDGIAQTVLPRRFKYPLRRNVGAGKGRKGCSRTRRTGRSRPYYSTGAGADDDVPDGVFGADEGEEEPEEEDREDEDGGADGGEVAELDEEDEEDGSRLISPALEKEWCEFQKWIWQRTGMTIEDMRERAGGE